MRYRPVRRPCDVPVHVTSDAAEVVARARSVSTTGLLIEDARGLRVETRVAVQIGTGTIEGRVAWVADGRAGIEFDTPQPNAALRAMGLIRS